MMIETLRKSQHALTLYSAVNAAAFCACCCWSSMKKESASFESSVCDKMSVWQRCKNLEWNSSGSIVTGTATLLLLKHLVIVKSQELRLLHLLWCNRTSEALSGATEISHISSVSRLCDRDDVHPEWNERKSSCSLFKGLNTRVYFFSCIENVTWASKQEKQLRWFFIPFTSFWRLCYYYVKHLLGAIF